MLLFYVPLFSCCEGVCAFSVKSLISACIFFLHYFFLFPNFPKYAAQEKVFCKVQLKMHFRYVLLC